LRIGSIITPSVEQAEALADFCGYNRTIEGASTLSQIAGTAALNNGYSHTLEAVKLFKKNLELAINVFNQTEF